MGILIPEKICRDELSKSLKSKGWKEGKFNGERVMVKEHEHWIWICELGDMVRFISLPLEENSNVHSEGVKKLKEEVREVAKLLGFSLPLRLEGERIC